MILSKPSLPEHPTSDYGLLATAPFLGFLFILPFTHTVALRLLCLLGMLGVTLYQYYCGHRGLRQLPITPPLIAWLTISLLSLTYSLDVQHSLGEIKNELGYGLIALLAFFLAAQSKRFLMLALSTLGVSVLVLTAFTFQTYPINNCWVPDAPHGGVGDFSSYLIYTYPFLGYLAWFYRENRAAMMLMLLMGMLTLIPLVWTQNRMALISIAIQLSVFLGLYYWTRRGRRIFLVLPALLLTALFTSNTIKPVDPTANIGLTDQLASTFRMINSDIRFQLWSASIEKIAENPFIGSGFGKGLSFERIRSEWPYQETWEHSHNLIIETAMQTGLPGAFILLWLLFALGLRFLLYFKTGNPDLRMHGVIGLVFLAGFCTKNLTDYFFLRHHSLFFWSMAGIMLGYGEAQLRKLKQPA